MTQTSAALLDAHRDYIAQLNCAYCADYVGRSSRPGSSLPRLIEGSRSPSGTTAVSLAIGSSRTMYTRMVYGSSSGSNSRLAGQSKTGRNVRGDIAPASHRKAMPTRSALPLTSR